MGFLGLNCCPVLDIGFIASLHGYESFDLDQHGYELISEWIYIIADNVLFFSSF